MDDNIDTFARPFRSSRVPTTEVHAEWSPPKGLRLEKIGDPKFVVLYRSYFNSGARPEDPEVIVLCGLFKKNEIIKKS